MRIIKIPFDIDKERPQFDLPAFDSVIQQADAEDRPVFVVSITGVLRSGKSFILNLMKIYLDYYENVSQVIILFKQL